MYRRVILPLERFDARTIGVGRLYVRHYRLAIPAGTQDSDGRTIIIVQHAAQALAPLEHARLRKMTRFRAD